MKRSDKILISKGIGSFNNKIQVFLPADRINPSEEITLIDNYAFSRSLEFNKKLDARVCEGDFDYYLTRAQFKKWKLAIKNKTINY